MTKILVMVLPVALQIKCKERKNKKKLFLFSGRIWRLTDISAKIDMLTGGVQSVIIVPSCKWRRCGFHTPNNYSFHVGEVNGCLSRKDLAYVSSHNQRQGCLHIFTNRAGTILELTLRYSMTARTRHAIFFTCFFVLWEGGMVTDG